VTTLLAFVGIAAVVIVTPGPVTALTIRNSLAGGRRAGVLTALGVSSGQACWTVAASAGVAALLVASEPVFRALRLAGAAYLVWLGWQMLRSADRANATGRPPSPRGGFFVQGCLVALSNPKTLIFFGAFFPQFIDPRAEIGPQIALLGATAMVFAALTDGAWAVLSGGAAKILTRARVRWLTRISGGVLIGGGVWLAVSRTR
jgi:homoserine/homoserine lactone efflux protein